MNSRNQGSLGKYVRLCSNQKSGCICGRSCFPPSILVQILLFSDLPPQSLYLQISFTNGGRHEGQGWPGASFRLTSLLSCLLLALSVPHHLSAVSSLYSPPPKDPLPHLCPHPLLPRSHQSSEFCPLKSENQFKMCISFIMKDAIDTFKEDYQWPVGLFFCVVCFGFGFASCTHFPAPPPIGLLFSY